MNNRNIELLDDYMDWNWRRRASSLEINYFRTNKIRNFEISYSYQIRSDTEMGINNFHISVPISYASLNLAPFPFDFKYE